MKTVVITGSARGLGFEMARVFRSNNVNVVISDLSMDKLEIAKGELLKIESNSNVGVCVCDVTKISDIKNLIDYTKKEFVNETGSYDIFSVINKDLVQNSSLYYALKGKNYNEEDKIIKRSLIKSDSSFEILFSNVNMKVQGLRIDLDEGTYRSYYDVHIYVNGDEVAFTSNCSYIDSDKMFFYHKDPILFVNFKGNIKEVYVIGRSEIVDIEKMMKFHEMKIRKEIE